MTTTEPTVNGFKNWDTNEMCLIISNTYHLYQALEVPCHNFKWSPSDLKARTRDYKEEIESISSGLDWDNVEWAEIAANFWPEDEQPEESERDDVGLSDHERNSGIY